MYNILQVKSQGVQQGRSKKKNYIPKKNTGMR